MTARQWVFRDTIDVEAKPVPQKGPRKPRRARGSVAIIGIAVTGTLFEFFLAFLAIELNGIAKGIATALILTVFAVIIATTGLSEYERSKLNR